MDSYEKKLMGSVESGNTLPDKLEIGVLQYLWQASPLSFAKSDNVPKFLSNIKLLNTFTDNERRIFSKFLHIRKFQKEDVIFKQKDAGYGFYLIFKGSVDILVNDGVKTEKVVTLMRHQYFGEMGLLEDYNVRSAAAVAGEETTLLGIFKPDLEDLLNNYPVVGAKLLREVSIILAKRLSTVIEQLNLLKEELKESKASL